jgi:Domain of unknown function (DUF4440)
MQPSSTLPAFVLDRQRALLTRDWTSLERLLDAGLRYVHATGARHDKEAYLVFARDGIRVESMRMDEAEAMQLGELYVVTGRLLQTIVRPGSTEPVQVSSWVTEVWRLSDSWRLLAFQSTRAMP